MAACQRLRITRLLMPMLDALPCHSYRIVPSASPGSAFVDAPIARLGARRQIGAE